MIYEADMKMREKLKPLFKDIDSSIILSYLQGHMGQGWVDDLDNPKVAQITVGIFVFYAGDPYTEVAEEMLHNLPDFPLVIVESVDWKKRIETVHQGKFESFKRYRFEKNVLHFNELHLRNFKVSLPEGFELKKVDEAIANAESFLKLSEDFISQFDSIEDFINRGTGYAILHNEQVVSAATSFSIYDNGIEIEIATDDRYRRKGLATITAAALILDCLEKGIYPSWDGANIESVKLAQKLGYVLKESYDTYFIDVK